MGLFGHKKEEKEKMDTNDIKNATVPQVPTPDSTSQNNSTNVNPVPNNDFSNPFAQDNTQTPSVENSNTINHDVLNQNPGDAGQMNLNPGQTSNPIESNVGTVNVSSQMNSNDLGLTQENEVMDQDKIQELIDETVEQVIEERWDSITANIQKVLNWKDKQEQQMNLIKEDIVTIRDNLEKVEKRVLNKISDYDKNILDVNSEIKALEKVFQKVTPTLINNVNELSRIANEFKGVDKKIGINEDNNNSTN